MYIFKLQAVLDHRQLVEDDLKRELAEIRQRIDAARQKLASLERKEMDTAVALKREQTDGLSSSRVVDYHAYLNRLVDRITRQKTMVGDLKEAEALKQEALHEATKKRQVLEKLKERGLERYNQEMLKKEMNFIDEIAVNQFARKSIQQNGGDR